LELDVPKAAAVSDLESHLGYWLRLVSNHVSYAFKAKVEAQGVTVAEWVIIRALFDGDGMRPSVLADRVGLTRGAVSKLIDRLTSKQLVACHPEKDDGRAQSIRLTAAGRRLVPTLASLADQNDAEEFGHLSKSERSALLAILAGFVEHHGLKGSPID
jgi:DNA-binding MarR family transcriptional regulator